MLPVLRSNLGLSLSLVLLLGGALICLLVGIIMALGGSSLRPIYWFAGFFSLIVVPQFLGHLYSALKHSGSNEARAVVIDQLAQPTTVLDPLNSESAKTVFCPDADPQLITDVRKSFGDVFAKAESAQFASLPNGESVLLAGFKGYLAAEKAWIDYLRVSGLNQLGGKGDSQCGYSVTRPAGDRAYILHMQTMVGVWTGPTDEAIRRRTNCNGPHHRLLGNIGLVGRS
jgi:hypothetical protein